MCGIAGLIESQGTPANGQILRRMTAALAHRGPDDEGYHLEGNVGLGHRRLSIIDLEGGHQPMSNEASSLWIVFNGEIYNHVELRQELEKEGVRFKTHSDTEVLLAVYQRYGRNCLHRLRGMFAFAIWDCSLQQLFIARDRLGKKPLYFYQDGERFGFASEFAALLSDERIPRHLDLSALDDYLSFGYVPSPRTILRGVCKLPPAHWATFRDGQFQAERYWQVSFGNKRHLTQTEAAEAFLQHLKEAVRIRLRSDVPLGILLSGGIDSSAVTALAAEMSGEPLETFSIGFEEAPFNELPYARLVAEKYSTSHHEFIVRPDALTILPQLVSRYGEPFADSSALPTTWLAQMTRRHVKVALNGDGGDELLAGYDRYFALRLSQGLRWLPPSLCRRISKLGSQRGERFFEALEQYPAAADRYARWVTIFPAALRRRLYRDSFHSNLESGAGVKWLTGLMERADADDQVEKAMQTDLSSYLPEDLLFKMDIATMAHGLEVRSPFLDHKLIEFTASLPIRWKLQGRRTKFLLLKALKDRLPADVFQRPKQGFGVPIRQWFQGSLRDFLLHNLLDTDQPSLAYFRREEIERLVETHLQGKQDHTHRLWALLMFVLWHRMFLERTAPLEVVARK